MFSPPSMCTGHRAVNVHCIRFSMFLRCNDIYVCSFQAMEHLQAFIADCDRRTELAKQRLAETQEELSAEVAQKANKVHELAEQIGKKLARAEQLGAEGFVEESMKLMEEASSVVFCGQGGCSLHVRVECALQQATYFPKICLLAR